MLDKFNDALEETRLKAEAYLTLDEIIEELEQEAEEQREEQRSL